MPINEHILEDDFILIIQADLIRIYKKFDRYDICLLFLFVFAERRSDLPKW